jgi:proline iminopeptidase
MTPDEHTNQEFFLDVGDGHRIYVQDWGKADAKIPIVFFHGGPGNGCDNKDKAKFNPTSQRVIFHDQRGAGKSTPAGGLANNTTQHLVEDIEKLANHLGTKKFILAGGSWGSTLSLVYGITHPERVAGMVIDGVYTATQDEADWFEKGGWRDFFPDAWEEYQATVPGNHKDNPSAYHYHQALTGNTDEVKKSSYAYRAMEISILKLDDRYQPQAFEDFQPCEGLIEMHYLANRCFLQDKYILKNASKLSMPVYIIQGRYDMVCRPRIAYELNKALPNSKLIWTINGHLKQHEAKNIVNLLIDGLVEKNG